MEESAFLPLPEGMLIEQVHQISSKRRAPNVIKTHGLRNEITTLHESASPGVLFTPLVWWQ